MHTTRILSSPLPLYSHLQFEYHDTHTLTRLEITMPGPANTLLIEGSIEELSDELAQYLDNLRKAQNAEGSNIQPEVNSLLQDKKIEDALKKLVGSASILNTAPEKGGCNRRRSNGSMLMCARNHRGVQPPHTRHTPGAQA